VIKRKAFDAGASEERIRRRNPMATMTTFERRPLSTSIITLEVVPFHAEWAANGIEICIRKRLEALTPVILSGESRFA
jgi:hypothetical protein